MKRLVVSTLAMLLAASPLVASPAGANKSLTNLKGSVTYGSSSTPTRVLAPNTQVALNDNDSAATQAGSEAAITLPDSSRLLMGANSKITMDQFDTISGIATAKFEVIGKVRFTVEHPAGARANYTFSTSTGQIAVRGTVGDIFESPTGGLQVNVYAISNPALPVQVTLANGQVFTLMAGQSLVATAVAGAVTASVGGISQASMSTFSELGPVNASAAGAAGATTTAAAAASTTATTTAAAVAAGTAAAATVVSNNSSKPTASPSPTASPTLPPTPTPQPSTTSVPIVITKKPEVVPGPVGPAGPSVPGPIGPTLPGPRTNPGAPGGPHVPRGRPSPRP